MGHFNFVNSKYFRKYYSELVHPFLPIIVSPYYNNSGLSHWFPTYYSVWCWLTFVKDISNFDTYISSALTEFLVCLVLVVIFDFCSYTNYTLVFMYIFCFMGWYLWFYFTGLDIGRITDTLKFLRNNHFLFFATCDICN